MDADNGRARNLSDLKQNGIDRRVIVAIVGKDRRQDHVTSGSGRRAPCAEAEARQTAQSLGSIRHYNRLVGIRVTGSAESILAPSLLEATQRDVGEGR